MILKEPASSAFLADMQIRSDHDILLVRQRVKQAAEKLGFGEQDRAQIAAAVAEIVRNAVTYAGGGRVTFQVEGRAPRRRLTIEVQDQGPGLPPQAESGPGIVAARQLLDHFALETAPGQGTTVKLGRTLPRKSQGLPAETLGGIAQQLAAPEHLSPLEEVQEQNQELLAAMGALRRSQEREVVRAEEWQATFEAIPDALCLLDVDGVIRRTNQALGALLGAPLDDLIGRPWPQVSPFSRAGSDPLQEARRTRCRFSADTMLHGRWYRIQVDPLLDEQGRPYRFVQLVVDITEEKLATERLARINDALKSYAHSISHDIKGPLSGAVTANQVLQQLLRRPLTDQTRTSIQELGEALSTSIGRTIDLVNEVLALAETGSGPGGAADVRRVVERVLEDRREALDAAGATVELGDDLGHVVAAPAHLYQIFANLVDNALRHRGERAPAIRIRRLTSAAPGAHRFEVRDNGPGIPAELLPCVFEPFVKGQDGGSGIGMATVRSIVEIYDGEVSARNEDGACVELVTQDQGP